MMDQTSHPKIICFAGGGAGKGRPYFSAYASSKAAIVRLVETFALEEPRVDINAITFKGISTKLLNKALEAGPKVIGEVEYKQTQEQFQTGTDASGMLELVDWLLSAKSNGVSGRFISSQWDDWKSIKLPIADDKCRLRRVV
jgi:3-oxoacyl-[acyl-carrier protein] reductase